jgi:GntR family transcriptional regulator
LPHKPLPVPLYVRVYGVIYQRIQLGRYPAGAALDTETELAAEFGVSKATIRQAVGELVDRGLLIRRQGKGTYVCDDAAVHPAHPLVGSLADLIVGTRSMSIRNQSIERDAIFPSDIVERLQMSETIGTVVRHHREFEGRPFAYAIVYVSPIVNGYLKPHEIKASGHVTLLNDRGLHIVGARQSMSADLADTEVARHLGIDFGSAVLFAQRVINSTQGPVEVSHTWYRGDLYKWEANLEYSWTEQGLTVSTSTDASVPRAAVVAV